MLKKYEIIYADPPWSYYNDSTVNADCTTIKGMRRPPYPVMSSQDIKNLPVNNIAAENSILFIWTTDYHLQKCLEVIKSWGFVYKTIGFVWCKVSKKRKPISFMGAYTLKSGCELCLLATKGKNAHKLVKVKNIKSFHASFRQEHSKKPDIFRKRIEQLCGEINRIELFARNQFENWDCWGNEVKSNIIL